MDNNIILDVINFAIHQESKDSHINIYGGNYKNGIPSVIIKYSCEDELGSLKYDYKYFIIGKASEVINIVDSIYAMKKVLNKVEIG